MKCAKKFTKDEINEYGQLVYFDKCLVFVLNANNADPTLKDEILEEAEQILAPESSETSKNSSSDDNLKKFSLEKLVFDTNVWLEDLEFCQKLVEEYKLVLGVPNTGDLNLIINNQKLLSLTQNTCCQSFKLFAKKLFDIKFLC